MEEEGRLEAAKPEKEAEQISRDTIEKRRKMLKRARRDRAARENGGGDQELGEQVVVNRSSSSKRQRKSGSRSVSPRHAALVTPPAGSKTTKKKNAEELSNAAAAADKQQRHEEKRRRLDGNDGAEDVESKETLLRAAELVAKRCREDPSDIDMLDKFGKLVTALRERHGIRIGSPFEDPSAARITTTTSSSLHRPPAPPPVGGNHGRGATSPRHFSFLPAGSAQPPRPKKLYTMTDDGDLVEEAERTEECGTREDGAQREGEFVSIAPRKPFETLNGLLTDGTIRAMSRDPKKAGSQGGPDVLAILMNPPTSIDQVSGGEPPECDMQIETTALLQTALNPTSVEIDRFVSVSLNLNRGDARTKLRPFRHFDKRHKDRPSEKLLTDRVDELYSALRNYIGLLDAVLLLKPAIRQALMLVVDVAYDFARDAPHSENILRAIGAFFLQEVEDVLRAVGSVTPVENIVAKIAGIDFYDPQAAHTSCITAHHLHKYTALTKAPRTPAGAPAAPAGTVTPPPNGGGGSGGGAGAGRDTRREKNKAKKEERKRAAEKDKAAGVPPAGRADVCPWWCSTLGCDPSKKSGGRACLPARHAMPTTEAGRLATTAVMNRFSLTARPDFPTSCPP